MIYLVSLAVLLIFLFLGIPLYLIIGTLSLIFYHFVSGENLTIVIGDLFYAADKEILLSIPMFILAGQIMTKGSLAQRLIMLMQLITCRIPNGLAFTSLLSCALFAAISGSSPVTLIAIGSILYPSMVAANYPKNLSLGLLTSAGTLGIIIPPSIPMIIYAIMVNVSVIDLFKAGILPGVLLVILLGSYLFIFHRGEKSISQKTSLDKKPLVIIKESVGALMMPILILGGIYSGYFTATESAVVAVIYALLIEGLVYRQLKWKLIFDSFVETAELLGSLFLILLFAVSMNKFLAFEEIPQMLSAKILAIFDTKISFIIGVNIFLLFVGCFMDIMSAILVLAPLLAPAAINLGIDPIHFGIMMIVNLEIGYLTPPIGINLFVASSIFKESLGKVVQSVLPFILVLLVGLIIISFVPELSLFFLNKK